MMIYSYPCGLELRQKMTVVHWSLRVTVPCRVISLAGNLWARKPLMYIPSTGTKNLSDVKCLDLDMQRSWVFHAQVTHTYLSIYIYIYEKNIFFF